MERKPYRFSIKEQTLSMDQRHQWYLRSQSTVSPQGKIANLFSSANFRFTKLIASSGNVRYSGLKTAIDRPRFMDGSSDWMLKL